MVKAFSRESASQILLGKGLISADHKKITVNQGAFIMIKFRSLFFARLLALVVFLLAISVLSGYSACFAQNPVDQTIVSKTVTIKSKGDGGIIIDGQHYKTDKSATILDVDGNKITLCDMPVPCEAVVEYQLIENQAPVCLRIETKKVLEATGNFVIVDDPG